jgi:hypothetical protein
VPLISVGACARKLVSFWLPGTATSSHNEQPTGKRAGRAIWMPAPWLATTQNWDRRLRIDPNLPQYHHLVATAHLGRPAQAPGLESFASVATSGAHFVDLARGTCAHTASAEELQPPAVSVAAGGAALLWHGHATCCGVGQPLPPLMSPPLPPPPPPLPPPPLPPLPPQLLL